MITPKELFQKVSKEDAAKLSTTVQEAWFQRAMIYARAQLSSEGISEQELHGANRFIETFTALGDEAKPPAQMPDKSQLKSYK